MFHDIQKAMLDRMKELEEIDARDRQDGTPQIKRLRQVPPEAGKVIAFLAFSAPTKGAWLEIGTSAGYSAMWISLAAKAAKKKLITFELLPEKVALARETFKITKLGEDVIELKNGDARGHISDFAEVAFCFLDCEKEMYEEIFERLAPNLIEGGLLVADNVINHKNALEKFIKMAEEDKTLDTVILPVGNGLLVSRKITI